MKIKGRFLYFIADRLKTGGFSWSPEQNAVPEDEFWNTVDEQLRCGYKHIPVEGVSTFEIGDKLFIMQTDLIVID